MTSTDQRLRRAERAQDQARSDREAVRAGTATMAQRYRDDVREGRRKPWTAKQVAGANAAIDSIGRGAAWQCVSNALTGLGVPPQARKHWHLIPVEIDHRRTWPRLRAWAERVLAETEGP